MVMIGVSLRVCMCVCFELKCAGNFGVSVLLFSVVVVEVGERRILGNFGSVLL